MFHITQRLLLGAVNAPLSKTIGGNVQTAVDFTVGLHQLPRVVNVATADHKLQGQTKKKLVIAVWSKRKNWNYVAVWC